MDGNTISFLRRQAIGMVHAKRHGVSAKTVSKTFDTACDVEFKLVRQLDEDDEKYQIRRSERRKVDFYLLIPQLFYSLYLEDVLETMPQMGPRYAALPAPW